MRLRPTKSTIALLSGVIGLVVIATGVVAWFQQGAINRTEKELADKTAAMHDGQKIARKEKEAREALEKDRSQILFLESGVSQAAFVPTLLKQLEDLAHSTDNQVVAVRPQVEVVAPSKLQQRRDPDAADKAKPDAAGDAKKDGKPVEKPEPYTRLNIEVMMVGGYKSTQDFIDKLTRFPKIMAVNEMQIKPHRASGKDADAPTDKLDVDMKVTAFIMKEQAPVSSSVASALTADASVGGLH